MTDLLRAAAARYNFRARKPSETGAEYRSALIRHVQQRDYAAAHELRLDKRQADWTSAEAQAFREHLQAMPRSAHELENHLVEFPAIKDPDQHLPVSDDTLVTMAQRALKYCVEFRTALPEKDFHPMVSVLLTDGGVLHAMPGRENRIRAIKLLSRQYPVYGYVVAADVFIHKLDRNPVTNVEHASKQDAFVVHVGSRTLRRIFMQAYRVESGRAIFEPIREPSAEMKDGDHIDDPYADVFVSVPMPEGKPS
jgi:hypothetical protein